MNNMVKAMVAIMVMLLTASAAFAVSEKANNLAQTYTQKNRVAATYQHELSISSNDFCLAQRFGHTDWTYSNYIYTMQSEKMLRSCLFDSQSSFFLTRTLAWYVGSTYAQSLSPRWYPSIPIAQRRLII